MTSTNEIKKERTFTIQETAKIIIIKNVEKNEDNTNESNLTSSQLKKTKPESFTNLSKKLKNIDIKTFFQ